MAKEIDQSELDILEKIRSERKITQEDRIIRKVPKIKSSPKVKETAIKTIKTKIKKEEESKELDQLIDNQGKDLMEFRGAGVLKAEYRLALDIFNKYKESYNIKSISDIRLLETLVYWEVIEHRIKIQIMEGYDLMSKVKSAEDEFSSPGSFLDSETSKQLKEVTDTIVKLKTQLGLLYEKKKEDDYTILEKTKAKVEEWAKRNIEARTYTCPKCSQMNILNVNPEYWNRNPSKHPFFRGKVLFNAEIIKKYKATQILIEHLKNVNIDQETLNLINDIMITKNSVAQILETSDDYADWLVTKGWVDIENGS